VKAPRYRLREAVVRQIVDDLQRAPFLEIGYGGGDLLVTLAGLGFPGLGFDASGRAQDTARRLLRHHRVDSIQLTDTLPADRRFPYILFFEVIGYIHDPMTWLRDFHDLLADDGLLIFSFTNERFCGDAERLSGQMRCFSRTEIGRLLNEAGYSTRLCWNYGYPLSNWLRPLLHWYYRRRAARGPQDEDRSQAVGSSGLVAGEIGGGAIASLVGSIVILPFIWIQRLFRSSDLGTGYVVVAEQAQQYTGNGS
jgi:SAM-dependent methyltransferase